MKTRILFALLAVSGCGQGGSPGDNSQADVVSMVKSGNGEACTNEATVQVVRNIVYGGVSRYGGLTPEQVEQFDSSVQTGLQLVTLDSVDRETQRVSCRGTFFATYNGNGGEAPIAFDVQPSLDAGGGIVINVEDVRGPRQAYFSAWSDYVTAVNKPANDLARARSLTITRAAEMCSFSNTPLSPESVQRGRAILADAEAAGANLADANFQCVRRKLEETATAKATPDVSDQPALKGDRIEYVGPPPIRTDPPAKEPEGE